MPETQTPQAHKRKSATSQRTGFVKGPRAETRQRLLDATLEYLRVRGISDLSMRRLAEEIGTSHRLLIYHFGTKEGLMVEVVKAIEEQQERWLGSIIEEGIGPLDQLRIMWRRTCDPALDEHLRLFVEIYGHTVQRRNHTQPLRNSLVSKWIAPLCDLFVRLGVDREAAPAHAHLALATIRGLMLDLLITGDAVSTGAAWDAFVARYASDST